MKCDPATDPYFDVDVAGNKHVHVNGRCYTNEELGDTLEAQHNALRAVLAYPGIQEYIGTHLYEYGQKALPSEDR